MSCWEVKDYLGELTDITAYGEDEILSLCRSCFKEIEAGLRAEADRTDIRITAAAAGLAFYKLALRKNDSDETEVTSFKAGDVSIEQSSGEKDKLLDRAERFYEKKLLDIIPLCRDNCFAFKTIG